MVKGLDVKSDPKAAAEQIKNLYNTFTQCDCTMVEVSPCAALPCKPVNRLTDCCSPQMLCTFGQSCYILHLFLCWCSTYRSTRWQRQTTAS